MPVTYPTKLPAELAEVESKFEAWRQQRQGRARIPPALWDAAVALVPAYGATRVSAALRLDFSGLKRRVEQNQRSGEELESKAPPLSFVALPSDLLLAEVHTESNLLLTHPNGATLQMRVPGGTHELAALVTAFILATP